MSDASDYEAVSPVTGGVSVSGFLPAFPPRVDAVLCLCLPSEMKWARDHGYPDPLASDLADFAWRPIPDDYRVAPDTDWLDATTALVEAWRRAGRRVLIHCAAGVSRSPTVTAAYLMRKYRWSAADAMAHVRVSRPVVKPNRGLLKLLDHYEASLRPAP